MKKALQRFDEYAILGGNIFLALIIGNSRRAAGHHGGVVVLGHAAERVARTATDAEFQNRIIIRDHTMNLPVVARQSHPDPNHAPHTAPRPPVAGAPNRRAKAALARPPGASPHRPLRGP